MVLSVNHQPRILFNGSILLLLLLPFDLAIALETSCHIHPPAEVVKEGGRVTIIGPFADQSSCEKRRQLLFGNRGRCHCSAGFTRPFSFEREAVSEGSVYP